MKTKITNTCQCSASEPLLLNGALSVSPIKCISCKKPVLIKGLKLTDQEQLNIQKWWENYLALNALFKNTKDKENWAELQLLDEIGDINLEGLELSQLLNKSRTTYYWMFQNTTNSNYISPLKCPFCGTTMEPIFDNDFKVCHPCKVAYPD